MSDNFTIHVRKTLVVAWTGTELKMPLNLKVLFLCFCHDSHDVSLCMLLKVKSSSELIIVLLTVLLMSFKV